MTSQTPTMMRALAAAVRANTPVLVWGAPGVGKTAVLEQRGRSWGRHVETISASSREAVDFMGLPMEDGGRVVYSPLSWALRLNEAPSGLLVVDEITTAASTFKAFLRIVQERYVGELRLGENVSVVAIANPPEIAVDGVDLPAPVANRFLHLDWHLDRDAWLDGVTTGFSFEQVPEPSTYLSAGTPEDRARAGHQVTAFLRAMPRALLKVPDDPAAQGGAWPSPRAWSNVVDVLTHVRVDDEDARDMVITGLVGQGACVEFLSWLARADLIDPADALARPASVPYAEMRPDQLFALLGSVTDLARLRGDLESWKAALRVMVRAARAERPDVALPSVRALLNSPHAATGVPDPVRAAFSAMFERTGRLSEAA